MNNASVSSTPAVTGAVANVSSNAMVQRIVFPPLSRLHHWLVRRLCALEDAPSIDAQLMPDVCQIGSVTHQPARFGNFTRRGCHGNPVARRHGGKLNSPAVENSTGANE